MGPIELIFISGIAVAIAVIIHYFTDGYDPYMSRIKFSTFKSLYYINTKKWKLRDDHITYLITKDKKVNFRFGLIDYYKYKYFVTFDKNHDVQVQDISLVMEDCKKEIQRYREKNKAEMEKLLKNIRDTKQND